MNPRWFSQASRLPFFAADDGGAPAVIDAAPVVVDPAAPAAEPAAPADTGIPSILDEHTEEAPVEPAKPEGEGDKPADEKPAAPEAYEAFAVPEGMTLDAAAVELATPIFKELGLDQGAAQKLIDIYAGLSAKADEANAQALRDHNANLIKAVKEDPTLGGAALPLTLASAKSAIAKFGTPELQQLLVTTGMSNEPEMLRFLKNVGEFDTEDRFERGGDAPAPKVKFGDFYNPEIMKKE